MKYFVIASDFSIGKGGLQSFAYYIRESIKYKKFGFDEFSRKDLTIKSVLALLQAQFTRRFIILTDWEQCIFIYPALLLAKVHILKSSFAVVLHGNEILNLKGIKKYLFANLVKHKRVFFIANSHGTAALFASLYQRKADYIAYPFIDARSMQIPEIVLKKVAVRKDTKQLLTITRLVKRKNVAGVVRALAILKKQGFMFHYNVIGDGPELKVIQSLIKLLGLEAEVTLKGSVSEAEKIKDLAHADLFILPSLYDEKEGSIEGYGIVFIEASLFGVPSISGNTGGMPDAVINGVTGFHCDGSVEDIAAKIQLACSHQFSRQKMIEHAHSHDYRQQDGFIAFLESKKL